MPARTQKPSHKIEKLKESNLNKNILIAETLEAFKTKTKFFPFKNTYFTNMLKQFFVTEIDPVLYQQDLKNLHWHLKID